VTEVGDVLARLRRLLPKIEKEEARRKKWNAWFQSIMRNGFASASETEIRDVLSRRYAVPRRSSKPRTRDHERRLKLQGKYIAAIRTLNKRERGQFRAALHKEGVRPAIVLAKRLAEKVEEKVK